MREKIKLPCDHQPEAPVWFNLNGHTIAATIYSVTFVRGCDPRYAITIDTYYEDVGYDGLIPDNIPGSFLSSREADTNVLAENG